MDGGMLAGLFDEEVAPYDVQQQAGNSGFGIPRPTPPRSGTRLCGLSNLGATCYMNALLQTLHYTPELREALFALSEVELGLQNDSGMIRAIPVQLQALFARMLIADQDSVGVEGLISSFGWTNNEEMQQHDVQELNRILFDAIESSLVGTSGEHLIAQLFHGTSVQKITCQQCSSVSEREEDFLDIDVALSGRAGLEEALKQMYCDHEILEGNNQYRCERCQCLVDAKRGCSLRKLPPLLTFSLLRFLYDFDKGERYKDTSRFHFPFSIDMNPYLDNSVESKKQEELIYDLFSVVIHSGSTHSGHYIAYIRDVDDLGTWTHPENNPVSFQSSLSTDFTDVLEFHSPLELLQAILQQCNGCASLSMLCKRMQDQTGISWNKRFKQSYGPISKFLKQHDDIFEVDNSNNISLKFIAGSETSSQTPSKRTETHVDETQNKLEDTRQQNEEKTIDSTASDKTPPKETKAKKDAPPPSGQCWYEFNDSHVTSLLSGSIEKMFQGKQSAYMLFYRLRSLCRPKEAMKNPLYGVPLRLEQEVMAANAALDIDRQQYDIAINTVTLTVHPAPYYTFANGALQNTMDGLTHIVKIDRRKTIGDLRIAILQEVGEAAVFVNDSIVIHTAKYIPAGLHLYDRISDDDTKTLMDCDVVKDCHLFVWDGIMVNGDIVPAGKENEPVYLHINYPGPEGMAEVSSGFSKDMTLLELKKYLGFILNCPPGNITLSLVKRSTRSGDASIVSFPPSKDGATLLQLCLENGDRFTAEQKVRKGYKSFAHSVADKQNKMITFLVENRCGASNDEYPVHPVEVSKTEQLFQIKHHILSQLHLTNVEGGGRLHIDDDFQGVGPPLCEEQSVADAGIEPGCRVILEPGHAPLSNQIVLKCSLSDSIAETHEVLVDRSCSVQECCAIMVATVGQIGEEWHLRKANWCGEPGEIMDDETTTLEQLHLRDGDCFLIKSGRLPPKGFVRLSVYLYIMERPGGVADKDTPTSLSDWFTGGTKVGLKRGLDEDEHESEGMEMSLPEQQLTAGEEMTTSANTEKLPLHEQDPACHYPQVFGTLSPIGDIEINKDSTIQDLKEHILTLSTLSGIDIPSVDFLRVRDLTNGRPARVFKEKTHTLRRLKLLSGNQICCQVLPNDEQLSASCIVFNMCLRHFGARRYSDPIEVMYDTAQSTTPFGLRNHIAHLLAIPPERLVLAKHKFESFQWIRIEDSQPQHGSDKGKKGRRRGGGKNNGKGGASVNIKNAPIMLRDGDIVGVKDLQYDPEDKDDFSTPDDNKGRAILLAIQEDKRQRRKVKSNDDILATDGGKKKRQRRPEVGIKIFVPDFSQASITVPEISANLD